MEHSRNIEQQITRLFGEYVGVCLEHNPDRAAEIMGRIDELLEQVPRQRRMDCA